MTVGQVSRSIVMYPLPFRKPRTLKGAISYVVLPKLASRKVVVLWLVWLRWNILHWQIISRDSMWVYSGYAQFAQFKSWGRGWAKILERPCRVLRPCISLVNSHPSLVPRPSYHGVPVRGPGNNGLRMRLIKTARYA